MPCYLSKDKTFNVVAFPFRLFFFTQRTHTSSPDPTCCRILETRLTCEPKHSTTLDWSELVKFHIEISYSLKSMYLLQNAFPSASYTWKPNATYLCFIFNRFRAFVTKLQLQKKCKNDFGSDRIFFLANSDSGKKGKYYFPYSPTWIGRCVCIIIRASFWNFCTASNSFLNTQSICSSISWAVSRNFILQLFRSLRAIFYCNFYQVLREM